MKIEDVEFSVIDWTTLPVTRAPGETGAAARIQKKDIDGLAITVIPEPGTALLMGLGLFALAGCGPRTAD
ncbi:MAG: PEP-CTERM sorting domain-containing protein [Deltaproteobacteria bacterium]|jgi:hypothetical protein|nr:PEP-CTERM sorting domain-containing protein [Deltaproteobacteria bacterium]